MLENIRCMLSLENELTEKMLKCRRNLMGYKNERSVHYGKMENGRQVLYGFLLLGDFLIRWTLLNNRLQLENYEINSCWPSFQFVTPIWWTHQDLPNINILSATARWRNGSSEKNVFQIELTGLGKFKPVLVIEKHAQKLNRRLCAVHLFHRHVHVIYEEHSCFLQ